MENKSMENKMSQPEYAADSQPHVIHFPPTLAWAFADEALLIQGISH